MTDLRFDGRTAIVTGAGRGVGRSHALLLAERGARVVVADLGGALDGTGSSSEPAELVVKEIEAAGGEAVACHASVADEAGAASIVEAAIDSFGRVDVVVNNAGIAAPLDWLEDLTPADYRRMIEVHYLGTVYVTKAAWPHMQAAGYGRIVNTMSEGAIGTVPKNSSYGSAKGAVLGFTKTTALDGARHGIGVNAVAPRANTRMATPDILAHVYDAPEDAFGSMPQFAADRVSPAAVYLAHESCRLSGEVLVAGGGQVLRLALMETAGFTSDDLTPELVAENIDTVLDMAGAQLMTVGVLMSDS
ncbi:MAG TPA: SDR family NAD(P)-dependent oxidoreductase [Acidimicrobiales bacterium]|nr:SDR family NAD(P)-dependent oxidoreductase [Acidimicrobiales bacterium]